MGKSDNEMKSLKLLSASFTSTGSDHPSGVLSFESETFANTLLKDKRKCREKGLKLKESVPLVYRDMQRKYRSEAYTKYMKVYATWIGFAIMLCNKKLEMMQRRECSSNGSRTTNLNQHLSEQLGVVL